MKAVVVTTPGEIALRDLPRPEPGPYQALVQTEVAALCNATDLKLIDGHFPGISGYPLALGHESAGIVCRTGEKVRAFKEGDRVIGGLVFDFADSGVASGWGGFCEYTLVNDHDAMVADGVADEAHGWFECYEIQRRVAPEIPAAEAALLCTWREVYGGIGDFKLLPENRVLICGGGPVGLSFVKFCRLLNFRWVGLADPLPFKRELALRMGADAVFAPEEVAETLRTTGPLDAVVDAVGSEGVVNSALPLIRMGGTIGVYGVIAADALNLRKASAPYNFNLIVHQWPTRWREREAQGPLCDWIREGRLSASEFVTCEFPVERVAEAFDAVRAGKVVKCLLRF